MREGDIIAKQFWGDIIAKQFWGDIIANLLQDLQANLDRQQGFRYLSDFAINEAAKLIVSCSSIGNRSLTVSQIALMLHNLAF